MTVDELEQDMRQSLSIPKDQETRIWNAYLPDSYENMSVKTRTLEEYKLQKGQMIVIEEKNEDGTWPYDGTWPSNAGKLTLSCKGTTSSLLRSNFPYLDGKYEERKYFENKTFILSSLNEDKTTNQLFCDFTIKVDEEEFKIHKCLLGNLSFYFRNMFTSEMKEKYQHEAIIEGLSAATMQVIIQYIYTEDESILNMDNVYDILAAADYLEIPLVLNYCSRYLIENMCLQNVLKTLECAKKHLIKTLLFKADEFVVDSFSSLVKGEEILELDLENVVHITKLNVKKTAGEIIFEFITRWINHDRSKRQQHFMKLFKHVKLQAIPTKMLGKMMATYDVTLVFPKCMKNILEMIGNRSPAHSDSQHLCFVRDSKNKTKRSVRMFNASSVEWFNLSKLPESNIGGVILNFQNNEIYSLGGRNDLGQWSKTYKSTDRWEIANRINSDIPIISSPQRCFYGCTSYNENLYITGGKDANDAVSSEVSYFNFHLGKWIAKLNMQQTRMRLALVAVNQLYAIGGKSNDNDVENSAEVLGMAGWKFIASMKSARYDFAAVVLYDQIYAIGGITDSEEATTSVERYDPPTNTWCNVASMTKPRSGHSACVWNEKIYVADNNDEAEVYDICKNTWQVLKCAE